MLRHEIIEKNEVENSSILYELVHPYLRSLNTYFKDLWCDEVIVMVTSVSNACQYVKFVTASEYIEALEAWTKDECEQETISANSKFLKQLIEK
jgi:hypothetical protein